MSATVTDDSARSPPASGVLYRPARSRKPSKKRSTQARLRPLPTVSSRGKPMERKAATGRAPMAARSLSPRAKARWPTASGGCQSRRKCLPAIDKSVVTASSSPCFSRKSAQSSPIPSTSPALSIEPPVGECARSGPVRPCGPLGSTQLCLTRILLRIGQAAERCGLVHYLWPIRSWT